MSKKSKKNRKMSKDSNFTFSEQKELMDLAEQMLQPSPHNDYVDEDSAGNISHSEKVFDTVKKVGSGFQETNY